MSDSRHNNVQAYHFKATTLSS